MYNALIDILVGFFLKMYFLINPWSIKTLIIFNFKLRFG